MYVGQNLFWVHDDHGIINWKHAIGTWYNQRFNMNDNFVEQPPGLYTNVSEFIQLIWAHSFKVSCKETGMVISLRLGRTNQRYHPNSSK